MTFEDVMLLTRTISSSPALEDDEARGLYEACFNVPAGGCVVEVGCQLGRSSSLIAQMAKYVKFSSIHIDPYVENPEYYRPWVSMMKTIGSKFILITRPTEELPMSGNIDMAFIDGSHEPQGVETDLFQVASMIRSGGLLLAHDYTNPGLPGVKQALDDFIDHNWQLIGISGSLGTWRRK